jgi:hypothetical protein
MFMKFSLPAYAIANVRLIGDIKSGLDRQDSIIGQIRFDTVVHGGRTRQVSGPNRLETNFVEGKSDVLLELTCVEQTDTNRFRDLIIKIQRELCDGAKRYLFQNIGDITAATGNTVDAQGGNVWDAVFEMTKLLPMEFDDEGNHNYQLYLHPDTFNKLKDNPPTADQERAMAELMEQKKLDFYAQKRSRRLS